MNKLIFKNSEEIQIADYASLLNIETMVDSYDDLEGLFTKLSDDNLSDVKFATDQNVVYGEYTNMTLQNKELKIIDKDSYLQVTFGIRQKTDVEMKQDEMFTAVSYLNDEQALTVKDLHKNWEDDPVGYSYSTDNPLDARRKYNGGLWKLNKSHKKQLDWFPGADPTLWTQLVEGYAGTLEDPIPVPDSVTTSGFEYEYGKYYLEGDTVYLCKRTGEADGGKITLYYMPSSLVDQYFVEASTEKNKDGSDELQDTETASE